MQALIDAETAAIVGDKERLTSEGKPLLLKPQAYSTLALLLHELVTNSTKYGSLSVPTGRTRLGWHLDPRGDLILQWSESDGPPVKQPRRKGFGTTIIERSIAYDLGGAAEVNYALKGITATFRIPARHVVEPKPGYAGPARYKRSAPGHPQAPPSQILKGQSVLLVEDSLIIALDAEDIL